jgi:Tfp pilus assembly protein PilF
MQLWSVHGHTTRDHRVCHCAGATGKHISGHEHLQIVERNEIVSKCILQINNGKFTEAEAQLSAILKKEPNCYQALVARGTCRALAGSTIQTELKKADVDFTKALEMMPLLADVWKRRSQARAALGNPDAAAQDLEDCLEKYSPSLPLLLLL